ncbi:MAG: UDP-2,3-diacylglucosamine diphosphatase [Gammaproteobacteria bacterium]|nr:UDP-2,3-diacylglucosamine diphosphatase [Gammaproteobacteria bacterium]
MIKYKTIWISDLHLGSKGASAKELLSFLKYTESDNLYLVGDIIDMWQLSKKWYWPKAHNEVVQKVLKKSRKGTNVIYVPGNHDETVRDFLPLMLGDIAVEYESEYISVMGERFLITHGDLYDVITRYHKWIAKLGDAGYNFLISVNRYLNWFRRKFKMGYWSLSQYVKTKVKNAASFIGDYENSVAEACKLRKYDGIICGHIHHAEMRTIDGVKYFNDGDFVESKTALVEELDGSFVILSWQDDSLVEIARWSPNATNAIAHKIPIVLVKDN